MILNVSFGIFALLPQGWIFMTIIILLECFILSYLTTKLRYDKLIYSTIFISNFLSGLVGFGISILLNGGWWLVVWFPWVSNHEVGENDFNELMIYYGCAFVLTLFIEGLINYLFLRKTYSSSKILYYTLLINIISYTFGSIALYSYSF